MVNPNSASFWSKNIKNSREALALSPIFIDKNKIILSQLNLLEGRILDIGMGYGVIEAKLTGNRNIDLYGIDISNEAIKYATNNFKGHFLVSSGTSMPFKSNFFSCVLVLDVLEHLYKKELDKTMKEINRVLQSRGKLIISVPINEPLKDSRLNRHVRKYNLNKIKKELRHFGFSVDKTIFLTAFRSLYRAKSIINTMFQFRNPNLLIVVAHKK